MLEKKSNTTRMFVLPFWLSFIYNGLEQPRVCHVVETFNMYMLYMYIYTYHIYSNNICYMIIYVCWKYTLRKPDSMSCFENRTIDSWIPQDKDFPQLPIEDMLGIRNADQVLVDN